jgi:hypothetical protein
MNKLEPRRVDEHLKQVKAGVKEERLHQVEQ